MTIAEVSRLFPDDEHGHLQELRTDPIGLLHRVREECGDIGRFRLADKEVVLVSGADVNETVLALCAKVGKVAVSCGDRSGFIVNALLFPYLNDAVKLLESGAATTTEIDAAIKEHAGFPMGPFALLDVVGNDVSLAIQKELYAEFGDPAFEPAETLVKVVADGHLGRKTGKGFHDYS